METPAEILRRKLLKKIDTAIIELNNFDNILKSQEVIRKLGLI